MNIPRELDDFNPDEWGNIELPGMSDEKLHSTNWNRVTAGKENKHNAKLISLAESKKGNTKFSETMSKAAELRNTNPEYLANLKRGCSERDNSYQAISNSKPEVRAKISATLTGKEKTAEHHAKITAKNKERSKPCITPLGIFASGKEAGEAYNKSRNVTNGKNAILKALKSNKEGYRYITVEEYIMLTGKEL